MTFKEAEKLKVGDKVYWADPDEEGMEFDPEEGSCSRVITIKAIEIKGDFLFLEDEHGSEVEVFPHELTYVS